MYCKKCGKIIDADSIFCKHCGSKQSMGNNFFSQNYLEKIYVYNGDRRDRTEKRKEIKNKLSSEIKATCNTCFTFLKSKTTLYFVLSLITLWSLYMVFFEIYYYHDKFPMSQTPLGQSAYDCYSNYQELDSSVNQEVKDTYKRNYEDDKMFYEINSIANPFEDRSKYKFLNMTKKQIVDWFSNERMFVKDERLNAVDRDRLDEHKKNRLRHMKFSAFVLQ